MQDFGTKADNSPPPGGQLSAAEFNNLATEAENAVMRGGQALNGGSTTQLATSIFLHAVKSQAFQDNGIANAYVATPVSGISGVLLPASYAEMNGAKISFFASNGNSGNSTLDIGQTTGTLLGAKKLLTPAGAEIPASFITAGMYLQAQYDSAADGANGAWLALSTPSASESVQGIVQLATAAQIIAGTDPAKAVSPLGLLASFLGAGGTSAADYVTLPYRDKTTGVRRQLIIQWGLGTAPASVTTTTFPLTFPNAVRVVVGSSFNNNGAGTDAFELVTQSNASFQAFCPFAPGNFTWAAIGY